ncbi:uncharacterized protein VTP21DRAFT_256 [Calcarisporiella thermophila]|uniref:uncharacterized protein n=1 Tax=Calcarisporiella thermophila TaxID=911321 RepID=UPI003743AF2B
MEFPELGKHCAHSDCNQLDFLPYSCKYCKQSFCQDHWKALDHNCPEYTPFDVRVPVCPICDQPVPINRGEDPNIKMNRHISDGCPPTSHSSPTSTSGNGNGSNASKKSNHCSFRNCRTRVLVPIVCSKCQLSFCVKHRLYSDHNCAANDSTIGTRNTPQALAALLRSKKAEAPPTNMNASPILASGGSSGRFGLFNRK